MAGRKPVEMGSGIPLEQVILPKTESQLLDFGPGQPNTNHSLVGAHKRQFPSGIGLSYKKPRGRFIS